LVEAEALKESFPKCSGHER